MAAPNLSYIIRTMAVRNQIDLGAWQVLSKRQLLVKARAPIWRWRSEVREGKRLAQGP